MAKKELSALYGGTGLDPSIRIRRKVAHYAAKKAKRRKESSSSSSDSEEGSTSHTSEGGEEALMDQNKIRRLRRHAPGLLTSMGVKRMQQAIAEIEGVWAQEGTTLPPCACAM